MKKKDNKETDAGDSVFPGGVPDRAKNRRRKFLIAALCALVPAAAVAGYFLLGRTSKVNFNPDLTVIPKKVVEKMAAPVLDSIVKKKFDVTETPEAVIYEPVTKHVPIRITDCTLNGDRVIYRFESTKSIGDFGTISGEMTVSGSPVTWQDRSGFLADIQGTATVDIGAVDNGSSNGKGLADDFLKKIPIDGDEVALPSGNFAYASIGRGSSGELFMISSKNPTTFDALSTELLSAGAEYAIFINGHFAYNWHLGDGGLVIDFASYTGSRPKGLSLELW